VAAGLSDSSDASVALVAAATSAAVSTTPVAKGGAEGNDSCQGCCET